MSTDLAPGQPLVPEHDLRGVLRIDAFRRLWTALSLSSLGDWLGLLALTALAPRLASGGYASANLAVAGVFLLRLAPAVVVGPLGGVVADRLDRRFTMVVCDVARFALFLSIPLVGTLTWLFVATFLIEVASLVWIPAKEATVPNLVPRERLETANQLSLFTTYGSAPVAALLFAGLALLTGILDNAVPQIDEVDLALYVNAATFLVSAATIARLRDIPARARRDHQPGVWPTLVEGWRFVGQTRLVRGLVLGMLGAFAAGGAVIGLARTFVTDLGGGDPGYGMLFGTVFLGLAVGMFLGPRLLPELSRRRLFGLALGGAGLALALLALVPNLVLAVLITLAIGALAGVSWVTGYTLLGLEVADEVRGRTFAFVQTMVRVVLVLVLAIAPLLAAALGRHRFEITDEVALTYNGAAIVFLLAGLLAAALGVVSYRHMDDRRGVPLASDLTAAVGVRPVGGHAKGPRRGFFVVLEGGEGAGKSTQAQALRGWLESLGHDVVVTFEPGATEVGRRLRSVLLSDPEAGAVQPAGPGRLSPRAEALLFAADRAEHVATVLRPALELGHVVISDRYVDSSVAYQGAGRELAAREIARLSRWATDGLQPDLTVLLDVPVAVGLSRVVAPDRVESEPVAFHERVRERYLELARRGGGRYLVLDATGPPTEVTEAIKARLAPMLPLSPSQLADIEREHAAAVERERLAEQASALERARAQEAAAEAARFAAEQTRRAEAAAAAAAEQAGERARLEAEQVAAERARITAQREAAAQQARQDRAARDQQARQERAARDQQARQDRAARDQQARLDRDRARTEHAEQRRGQLDEGRVEREPATRELSLVDELFGVAEEDQTVQLPRVEQRPEER